MSKLYQEGIIGDAMKKAGDAGATASRLFSGPEGESDYRTAMAGDNFGDKAAAIDSNIATPASNVIGTVNNRLLQPMQVNTRSIISRARDSILQFPVYCSRSLRPNEAQVISDMFNRVYTTFVQTVISQNQIIDEKDANNMEWLKQFHTNLKEAVQYVENIYYKPIDEIDQMMKEAAHKKFQLTKDTYLEFTVCPPDDDLIFECNRLQLDPAAGIAYIAEAANKTTTTTQTTTKNDSKKQTVSAKTKISVISNDEFMDLAMNNLNYTQTQRDVVNMSDSDLKREIDSRNLTAQEKIAQLDAARTQRDEWIIDVEHEVTRLKNDIKAGKVSDCEYSGGRFIRTESNPKDSVSVTNPTDSKTTTTTTLTTNEKIVDKAVDAPMILKDADIKRINSAVPYTIHASFRVRNRNGNDRDINFVIGIKTILHPILINDLADELRDLIMGRSQALQNVRYKTGEITFMDKVFNLKGLKKDALNSINPDKGWINSLKKAAEWDRLNGSLLNNGATKFFTHSDVAIPNGTLVLTQGDVTTLTNQTGINLGSAANAIRLARSLFLIAVVIIDSTAGSMQILLPDMSTDWEVQSMASIENEVSKTDNNQLMKELNRLVNK